MTAAQRTMSADHSRFALVTGAASGLGRALARRLAADGWSVALADRDAGGNAQTLELIQNEPLDRRHGSGGQPALDALSPSGGKSHAVDRYSLHSLDVTDANSWRRLRDELRGRWPRIDLLINCAGVCGAGEVGEFSLDDWRWMLETNLFGVVHGCHFFVPWLRENPGRSRVVNIASVAAFAAAPAMAAYNVAKAGVVALSETLFAELRPHGVGVTVVCPGFFATKLIEGGRFAQPEYRDAAEQWVRWSVTDADRVAAQVLRAVAKRRFYVIVPGRARLLWHAKRLAPMSVSRLTSWLHGRWRRGQAKADDAPPASGRLDAKPTAAADNALGAAALPTSTKIHSISPRT